MFTYLIPYQQVGTYGRPQHWQGVIVSVFDVTNLPIHHINQEDMCQRVEINNPGSFCNYVKSV